MIFSYLRKSGLVFSLPVALLLLATGGLLLATVVPRVDFEELNARSARIIHARCVATDAFLEAESGTIWTRNYFEIFETLKGESAARIVVMEPGGIIGNQGQWVPGAPRFSAGDESVLFLSQTVTGKWRVFGWGQGNFRVTRDTETGAARVKPDLAGAEVVLPAGTSAEAAMLSHSDSGASETLEALKVQIRNQIFKPGTK